MSRSETFLWYDLETFGLNPRYDRIAQFAAVRTDSDLKVIGEPTLLYCRLSDDYLPDPLACMVTGITPQKVTTLGLKESEFIQAINELMSVPRTCSVGYNSLKFDDEFIRNTLFRNFLDPYKREYDKGNSRWDLLDLVRAAHDFGDQKISWPKKESGITSCKLTDLTAANAISHEGAHDALSDVWATLNLARLIKTHQPKLFSYYLKLRNKQAAKEMLSVPMGEPVVYTAAPFTRKEGFSTVVMPLSSSSLNSNVIYVFDLLQDPQGLLAASRNYQHLEHLQQRELSFRAITQQLYEMLQSDSFDKRTLTSVYEHLQEAADLLGSLPHQIDGSANLLAQKGVYRIALNRSPFLSPLSVLTNERLAKLQIDMDLIEHRSSLLRQDEMLGVNIRKLADQEEYPSVADVDFTLYSGPFFSQADERLFAQIRQTKAAELWKMRFDFNDARAHQMLWRFLCRNWSEELDAKRQKEWQSFCAERIISPPGGAQVNLSFYARKIEEHLQSKETEPHLKEVLHELKLYGKELCHRIGLTYPEQ
ncbi:MAG: exodeoxyribonuclease I [Sphaerochaetaceae bacterium]